MTDHQKPTLTYKSAGVNIERASKLVEAIKPIAARTHRSEVVSSIGGFGAMFAVPEKFKNPILVSGTDGVGTKLKLALTCKHLDAIGVDLVAMCVNDIICHGAEPLFFLDYYATGQLDNSQALTVIQGIAKGCLQSHCALIGGETAELPNQYRNTNDVDLAGFVVGAVEQSQLIDGKKIRPGDSIIALSSSGPHSNGYALIRKILEVNEIPLSFKLAGLSLQDILLTPTRIYAPAIKALTEHVEIHGIAHITGGGLIENVPRILPPNTKAMLDNHTWQWPQIFTWLQEQSEISTEEMQRTFNLGVGMIIVVAAEDEAKALNIVSAAGELAWHIGKITASDSGIPTVDIT